ncbi:hypothetical protein O6H91_05G101600 [Diphasiastrum complanatum]|uniref:Uncharacterized protein n=2 Tax=Diphasiastrum complanatum TaxID=34168 RepID=A0ACC2DRT3_DIPCM|nr:hypothetical protein O6H91_05G101600 [Diphasiastrum complanatum]KAJ7556853.1 hypothetical protein O6H91_05G101600 [Diphasiastrum complanatum]
MNPSGSSGDQPGAGWNTDNWEHPSNVCHFPGFGGHYQTARPDWEWDNQIIFSQNQAAGSSDQGDIEHKPAIFSGSPGTDLRHYSGVFPTTNFSQNPSLNVLNQTGIRNYGGFQSMQNIPTVQSFHGGLGSGIPGLAATNAMTDMRSFDQRRRLLEIMDFEHRSIGDLFKREELYPGDVHGRIGLNLAMGGRTYFSAEDSAAARLAKRPRLNSPAVQMPMCQAEGCTADLSRAKHYHRRHKVCEIHSKAASVMANGQTQRFCQQCSRFHVLSEFDEAKRSCRKRLADHNRRRRKPQPNTVPDESTMAQSLTLKPEEHNLIHSNKPTGSAADTTSMLMHFPKTGSPSASTEELNNKRNSNNISSLQLNASSSFGRTDEKPGVSHSFLLGSHNSAMAASDSQPPLFSNVSLAPSVSLLQGATRNFPSTHMQQATHEGFYHQYLQGFGQTGPNLSLSSLGGDPGMGTRGLRQPTSYTEADLAAPWRRPAGLADFSESSRPKSSLEWMGGSISCQEQGQAKRLGSSSLNFQGNVEGHGHSILALSECSTSREGRAEGALQQSHVPLEFLQQQSSISSDDAQDVKGQQSDMKFSDLQPLRPFGSSVYD